MNRPNLHVMTGTPPRVDLRTLRAKHHQVARALLKAQRAVDKALREYQEAYDLATDERAPVNSHTHDRITEALVGADCLLRTEIALRSAQAVAVRRPALAPCPHPGQPLETGAAPDDEES